MSEFPTCKPYFFPSKLFEILPEVYRNHDQYNKLVLKDLGLGQDGKEKKEGQLERFLHIFEERFDEIKCLIDNFPILFDVDRCPCKYLPYLAALLGIDFNYDLSCDLARQEIRDAVSIYKKKGTIEGIKQLLRSLTNYDVQIVEFYKNLLINNKSDTTRIKPGQYSADVTLDKSFRRYSGTVNKKGFYRRQALGIVLTAPMCDSDMSGTNIKKIERLLNFYVPAGVINFLIIIHKCQLDVDVSFNAEIQTTHSIYNYDPTGPYYMINWLRRNFSPSVRNNPNWTRYRREAKIKTWQNVIINETENYNSTDNIDVQESEIITYGLQLMDTFGGPIDQYLNSDLYVLNRINQNSPSTHVIKKLENNIWSSPLISINFPSVNGFKTIHEYNNELYVFTGNDYGTGGYTIFKKDLLDVWTSYNTNSGSGYIEDAINFNGYLITNSYGNLQHSLDAINFTSFTGYGNYPSGPMLVYNNNLITLTNSGNTAIVWNTSFNVISWVSYAPLDIINALNIQSFQTYVIIFAIIRNLDNSYSPKLFISSDGGLNYTGNTTLIPRPLEFDNTTVLSTKTKCLSIIINNKLYVAYTFSDITTIVNKVYVFNDINTVNELVSFDAIEHGVITCLGNSDDNLRIGTNTGKDFIYNL